MSESIYKGCGSHSCYIEKPKGQGTNSSCSCLRELPSAKRLIVQKKLLLLMQIEKITVELNETVFDGYEEYQDAAMKAIRKIEYLIQINKQ